MRKQEDLNYYIKSRNIKDVDKFYRFLTMKRLEKFESIKFYEYYCEFTTWQNIKGSSLFYDNQNLIIKINYHRPYYKDAMFNKFESILGKRVKREDEDSL